MSNWVQQLLQYHDSSKDGKLDINELVQSLSPSVGNTYDCTAAGPCKKVTMSQDQALQIGKRNAKVYLAMLLKCVPSALQDNVIDLSELQQNATCTQIDTLFETSNGKIVVDENGFGVPTPEGAILLQQTEQYLN